MVKTRGSTSGPSSSRKKADDDQNISVWSSDVENETDSNYDDPLEDDTDEEYIPPSNLQSKLQTLPRRRKIILRAKKEDVAKTPINYKLKFEQLGGLEEQIRVINESIIFRHRNAAALKRSGLKHTIGGILLEGPPGTGKTVCAHTIAAELSRQTNRYYSFYTHNAVESFSKWMGDTEKSIRKLFESAAENKPSIIFFDEFDSLCPRRDVNDKSGGHTHSYTTIVGTLLAEFNNIQDNEIIIIATTNLKSSIDPAMLRNGRFDFSIHFPLPNEAQRNSILRIKMQNYIVTDEVYDFMSKKTEGFSGSSLTFLCDEAKLNAFKRQQRIHGTNANLTTMGKNKSNSYKRKTFTLENVEKEDFLQVFKTVQLPVDQHQFLSVDVLFNDVCDHIISKLKPYVFTAKDQMECADAECTTSAGLICNCYSNCFLVWSKDSNAILNDKILPRVLNLFNQPVYKISQEVLNNLRHEKYFLSTLNAFHHIVSQAKRSGKPSILVVENLDELLSISRESESSYPQIEENQSILTPEYIFRELSYLGNHLIFVLATSSKGTSKLPTQVQQLFKPFSSDKALELPMPTSKDILETFANLYTCCIEPTLDTLTVMSKGKGKRYQQQQQQHKITAKSFMTQIQQYATSATHTKFTFQQASALRSEICTLCRVSDDPHELTQNILALLQPQ